MKKKTTKKKRATKKIKPCAAVANVPDAGAARTTSRASASTPSASSDALTDKQARFIAEYLIDLNAAAAARRAGYSAASADQQGYENLRKPEIAAAIAAGKARQMREAGLSAARVLEELRRIAFVNVRDYFDGGTGDAKHPHQLTAEQGACLAGFEVLIKNVAAGDGVTDTIHKFKLWDKPKALELLMKHFGLLVEKVEIKTTSADARVARLVAARKRTA